MKDLKVDEIVSSLIQFRMSPEKIESSINRLKENPSQQIKYVSDEELFLHFAALSLFVVDYSTFSVFGDTNIKNIILDKFYNIIKISLPEEYPVLVRLVSLFSDAYTDKSKNEPLLNLGLVFSKCIIEGNEEDLITAMKCSSEFSASLIATGDNLKGIKSDYNILLI